MKSDYKLPLSGRAVFDLQNIIDYLRQNWTDKEVKNFVRRLDKRLGVRLITLDFSVKLPGERILEDLCLQNTRQSTTRQLKI